METMPMPLSPEEPETRSALDDFRITEPFEILSLLRQMQEQNSLLTIATPRGASFVTTIFEVNKAKGVVRFAVEAHEPQLERVLDSDEVVAVGYLDSVKIQFDLDGLVHVHAGQGESALNGRLPREVFRFQRRASYRVRPLSKAGPSLRLRHPALEEVWLDLRILDVSIGGLAVFVPEGTPLLQPGTFISQSLIELDDDTRFNASLRVAHITAVNDAAQGVRMGCEMEGMSGESLRALQRFIDQTQKQRRLMALDRP